MSQRFDAFFSRTTAFARRVFPTHNELICGPRCVGKMMTPATTCNSRFAGGFPRLTGIFAGKTRKNSSSTPSSGIHNSPVQIPIRTNFISLESRRREISGDMLHDLFWIPKDLQNGPRKSGQKRVRVRKSRRIRWRGCVADKIATWWAIRLAQHHHAPCGMMSHKACSSAYKTDPPPPPPISNTICLGSRPSWA